MIAAASGHHLAGAFPRTRRDLSYDSKEDAQDPRWFERSTSKRRRRPASVRSRGTSKIAATAKPDAENSGGPKMPRPAPALPMPPSFPSLPDSAAADRPALNHEDTFHRSVTDNEQVSSDENEPEESVARVPEKKDKTWWKRFCYKYN